MCEPTTIAIAATLASGAFTAYQANEQGKYQSAVMERNAEMQEQQATAARAEGVIAGEEQRDRARALGARQATGIAASGLDLSSGTSLDLFSETATLGEYDAQIAENNAARQAYGYQTDAVNSRTAGRNARAAGRNQAIGTLLTSGSQAAGMYSNQYGGRSSSAGRYRGGSFGNIYG